MIVWLWQADGPAEGGLGISGEQEQARRPAAARLRSGAASSAVVTEAVAELDALDAGYRPTGRRWEARVDRAGRVRWAQAAA